MTLRPPRPELVPAPRARAPRHGDVLRYFGSHLRRATRLCPRKRDAAESRHDGYGLRRRCHDLVTLMVPNPSQGQRTSRAGRSSGTPAQEAAGSGHHLRGDNRTDVVHGEAHVRRVLSASDGTYPVTVISLRSNVAHQTGSTRPAHAVDALGTPTAVVVPHDVPVLVDRGAFDGSDADEMYAVTFPAPPCQTRACRVRPACSSRLRRAYCRSPDDLYEGRQRQPGRVERRRHCP